ncbi:MAG: DEAD/DEAH box helicase [Leptolyngbyaceae cyanobacterium]
MVPAKSLTPIQQKLLSSYQKLSATRQRVLQMFAIAYAPITRSKMLECLIQVGIVDDDGNRLNSSRLKTHIDSLISARLVLQQQVNVSPRCNPEIAEIAARDVVQAGSFAEMAKTIQAIAPVPHPRGPKLPRRFDSNEQFLREFRIALYGDRFDQIEELLEEYYNNKLFNHHISKLDLKEIVLTVFNNPFDPEWFAQLLPSWHDDSLATILTEAELTLVPAPVPYRYLCDLYNQSHPDEGPIPRNGVDHPPAAPNPEAAQNNGNGTPASSVANGTGTATVAAKAESKSSGDSPQCPTYLQLVLVQHLIWRGDLASAKTVLETVPNRSQDAAAVFWGWLSFLEGNIEEAIAHYTLALKSYRKAKRKKNGYFNTAGGVFFILALLKEGSVHRLHEAQTYCEIMAKQRGHWLQTTYDLLSRMIRVQQGDLSQKYYLSVQAQSTISTAKRHSLERLINGLCFYWADRDKASKVLAKQIKAACDSAHTAEFTWLAAELASLLIRVSGGKRYVKSTQAFFQANSQSTPLVDLIRPLEAWELSLKALTNLKKDDLAPVQEAEKRMVWNVTLYGGNTWMLQPREQKVTKSGKWSKGRNIAIKRLYGDRAEFDYLTPHDQKVLNHLQAYRSYDYYYGGTEYKFEDGAMLALVGHPNVYWDDNPTIKIDVVKGEPELLVEDKGDGTLDISFSLKPESENAIAVYKESPTRIKVIEITDDYRQISKILGSKNTLTVPFSAKDQVLSAINSISSLVTVHSDIGGGMESVEEVPADATPHLHLLPSGEGLSVSLLCRPFSEAGPYYAPGSGGKNVVTEIEGQRLQTNRNLQLEQDLALAAVTRCPTLARYGETEHEWLMQDPEDCLELLCELQDLGEGVVVEWPEGETMRVSHRAGFGQFHLNIGQQQDWFAATGELKLDDQNVLTMRQLLALLEQTTSRFIQLDDGQFVALTNEFRKRLDEMRSFAEQHGDGLRFHPLASLAMDDMFEDMEHVKADKHWKQAVKKIREMESFEPELPSTLQADLRDYQQDGFEWMSRLAYWGVGACLADDMGLGKTLQALSVILTRAPDGPTLIIAPTSVGMNWMGEAQKFAPTLNPMQFGSGDRQTLLDNLKPFDMLVCTYGLLQQDEVAAMLAGVEWQTIVLDEAQAIKNANTKRSKAAMQLNSSFKVLTTGTPIENHLGELWNLFRFINPGLLGSMDKFNQRFAYPIERDNDKYARTRLKKLISPFILRRTKNQVLDELPSRTEITLQVELSKEEMAMYEALRREAVDRLSDTNQDLNAGTKHLQVLAEIMKLRRMCCNPRLILPETDLMGSKLEVFGEVLEELLENRHKALVFSQFVDHLTIIRNYLDEKNIHYQYLDGSTPAKARKQRVDAFQSGDGDVFLISLKAGGTGLNLTAADYVIHMDPWWNPAVEDQASDRAHRIGQKRPVTIYRLVAQHTIEEKIVALHHQKRDLADSLLDGTDMSGKISTDDLIKLMSEG